MRLNDMMTELFLHYPHRATQSDRKLNSAAILTIVAPNDHEKELTKSMSAKEAKNGFGTLIDTALVEM